MKFGDGSYNVRANLAAEDCVCLNHDDLVWFANMGLLGCKEGGLGIK